MDYINDLNGRVSNKMAATDDTTLKQLQEQCGLTEEQARMRIKTMGFADYAKLQEGDNPFGSFSSPGEKPGATNKLNVDPDQLEIGDMVDYVDQMGNKETGKLASEPDQAGRLDIERQTGGSEQDVMLQDLMGVNDEDMQRELQRIQKLAGIGAANPEMDECSTGGSTGAGAVGAAPNVNPHTRKHSPHGSAFKSARGKTAEVKRSVSKRRPKK